MKKIFIIFAVLAISVAGVVLAKNQIAKASVVGAARALTGLNLTIGRLDVGIMNQRLVVADLRLGNPASFKDPIMVDLHELYVNYDLAAMMQKRVHLRELRIDLREFYIIKNTDGTLNLDALKPAEDKDKKPAASKGGQLPVQIDTLHLRLGKIVYKDYSAGGSPSTQEFVLNLDETYQNVTDPKSIVPLIIGKVLMNTTIGQLANINPTEMLSKYAVNTAELGKMGLGGFASLGKGAGAIGSGIGDSTKKTTEELKKLLPF